MTFTRGDITLRVELVSATFGGSWDACVYCCQRPEPRIEVTARRS
ncbi:MAG: hypothetical protein ACT4PT_09175 [Methanobacteriota archaeon]